MIAELNKHSEIKTILVHVLDRMHRNAREQLNMIYDLKVKGIRILTVNGLDTSNEEHMSQILDEACQAEKYSRRLSQETRKGMLVNAQKGLHNGGIAPYGYKVGSDMKYEVDEKTAPAVRKIFEMYRAGLSYAHIIDWLDKNGYNSVKGEKFAKATLKAMLSNMKYTGTYVWDRTKAKDFRGKRNSHLEKEDYIVIENAFPAIISKELFEKVQERFRKTKSKVGSYNGKNYYPMNGRIFCKKCRQPLSGCVNYSKTTKGGKPRKLYMAKCGCHDKKTVNRQYLDDMIIYALRECIFSSVNTDELIRRLNEYAQAVNSNDEIQLGIHKEELADLKKRQGNLVEVLSKGTCKNSVLRGLEDIEKQIQQTKSKIAELSGKKKEFTAEDLEDIKKAFVPFVRDLRCEENLTMLGDLISRVDIGDEISVMLKENIRVDKDTKKNFN